jgi:hypothetical protein
MKRIERHEREVEVFHEGATHYSMNRPRIYTHPPRLSLGTDEELEKFKNEETKKMMWKFYSKKLSIVIPVNY